jgi:hypothetical protein
MWIQDPTSKIQGDTEVIARYFLTEAISGEATESLLFPKVIRGIVSSVARGYGGHVTQISVRDDKNSAECRGKIR